MTVHGDEITQKKDANRNESVNEEGEKNIKENPELYEQAKIKERQRYQRRKKEEAADQPTGGSQNSYFYSPEDTNIATPSSSRNRSKDNRELEKVKKEMEKLMRKSFKYKTRYYRLKDKHLKEQKEKMRPKSKVERELNGKNVPLEIKKKVLSAEVLKTQLEINFKARGADIPDLDSLASVLKQNYPGITFKVVVEEDIEVLNDVIPLNIKPFKGTMKARQLVWTLKYNIMIHLRRLSCLTYKPPNPCLHYHLGEMLLVPAVNKNHLRYSDIYSDSSNDDTQSPIPYQTEKKIVSEIGDKEVVDFNNVKKPLPVPISLRRNKFRFTNEHFNRFTNGSQALHEWLTRDYKFSEAYLGSEINEELINRKK
ncbi:unnamed protein product [Psylliodes chrysocephalus]|uniref:Uncharacterized protein n=1 Tax=Psylliodes chrysocephalus TaxID=3402493 RepID=A0A9P0CUA3_9CUCU|nr:unnamed protein product [Psylliodes chrysocephala]